MPPQNGVGCNAKGRPCESQTIHFFFGCGGGGSEFRTCSAGGGSGPSETRVDEAWVPKLSDQRDTPEVLCEVWRPQYLRISRLSRTGGCTRRLKN